MSNSLSDGVSTLVLPDDLDWKNRHSASPVSQSVEWGVDGALIVDACAKKAGVPIVLEGAENRAWMPRSDVDKLRAWARVPGQALTLTLVEDVFSVIFDNGAGALEARALHEVSDPPANWPHRVSLKFLTI